MELKDYQAAWHSLLMGASAREAAEVLKSPTDDLKLYQGFIRRHYTSILEIMFKRSFPLLPYDKLVKGYYEDHPPIKWDLNDLTEEFPTYLEKLVEEGKVSLALKELAEFELAEFQVYKRKTSKQEEQGICLNPALEVLVFQHDIMSWVHALEKDKSTSFAPAEKMQILAISRGPKGQCVFTELGVLSSIIVNTLSEQEIVQEAAHLVEQVHFLVQNSPLKEQLNLSRELVQTEVESLRTSFIILG